MEVKLYRRAVWHHQRSSLSFIILEGSRPVELLEGSTTKDVSYGLLNPTFRINVDNLSLSINIGFNRFCDNNRVLEAPRVLSHAQVAFEFQGISPVWQSVFDMLR